MTEVSIPHVNAYYAEFSEHGAMELDDAYFRVQAGLFAAGLRERGFAHAVLTPGDGTRYEVMAVSRYSVDGGAPFMFGSNHGGCYDWNATPTLHPHYVTEHWTRDGKQTWTGLVYARFMNHVGLILHGDMEQPTLTIRRIGWHDYQNYITACQAENLEPHSFEMWMVHECPAGPLG